MRQIRSPLFRGVIFDRGHFDVLCGEKLLARLLRLRLLGDCLSSTEILLAVVGQ